MAEISTPIKVTSNVYVAIAKCHGQGIDTLLIPASNISGPLECSKGIDLAHEAVVWTSGSYDVVARPINDIVAIISYDVRIFIRINCNRGEVVIVGSTPSLNPGNSTHVVHLEEVHVGTTLGLVLIGANIGQ